MWVGADLKARKVLPEDQAGPPAPLHPRSQPQPPSPCPRCCDPLAPGLTPSAGRSGVGERTPFASPRPLATPVPIPSPPPGGGEKVPCLWGTRRRRPHTGSGSGSSWRRVQSRCWGPRVCRRPGSALGMGMTECFPLRRPHAQAEGRLATEPGRRWGRRGGPDPAGAPPQC